MGRDASPMVQRDLVVLDVETTGLDFRTHALTEIAAIRVTCKLVPVARVHRLVRVPQDLLAHASPEALKVSHYDADLWKRFAVAPRVALLELAELFDLPGDAPIVLGLNVAAFDWRFVERAFESESLRVPEVRYFLDVGSLAWPLVLRGQLDRIGLAHLAGKYQVELTGKAHTALVDCETTLEVYKRMLGLEVTV